MGVSPEFIEAARLGLGAIVKRSYGSSEAPTVSSCANDDTPERCRDTDGRAFGDTEIRIVDPVTGRRPGPARRVRSGSGDPSCSPATPTPRQTETAVHRGWFRSGDLGVVDDQGWLTITGRLKDLIIRGGENISSAEVERALEAHPDIDRAVVVGCPRRAARRAGGGLRGGPSAGRRGRVPWVVLRVRRRPVQDPRGGRPDRRSAAAPGRKARPGLAEGAGAALAVRP